MPHGEVEGGEEQGPAVGRPGLGGGGLRAPVQRSRSPSLLLRSLCILLHLIFRGEISAADPGISAYLASLSLFIAYKRRPDKRGEVLSRQLGIINWLPIAI
jgi:hypothetical protein